MNLRPRSYPRRKRLPSTATTPAIGPRPSASRNAAVKAAKALDISSGSSSRNRREKLSWDGAPCGNSTISASMPSLAAAKSAISTQFLAPHSVAISATNNMDAQSCRAFRSRGSRTSRKIVIRARTETSRIEKSPKESLLIRSATNYFLKEDIYSCAIPLPRKGEG